MRRLAERHRPTTGALFPQMHQDHHQIRVGHLVQSASRSHVMVGLPTFRASRDLLDQRPA